VGNIRAETAMCFEGRVGRRLNWTLLEKKNLFCSLILLISGLRATQWIVKCFCTAADKSPVEGCRMGGIMSRPGQRKPLQ